MLDNRRLARKGGISKSNVLVSMKRHDPIPTAINSRKEGIGCLKTLWSPSVLFLVDLGGFSSLQGCSSLPAGNMLFYRLSIFLLEGQGREEAVAIATASLQQCLLPWHHLPILLLLLGVFRELKTRVIITRLTSLSPSSFSILNFGQESKDRIAASGIFI